jgi:plastocyanin
MQMRRLTIPLAAAALLAAGCGGSSSGSSSTPTSASPGTTTQGTVVEIDVASSGFAFVKTSATAPAGTVTLRSMNPQAIAHDISIKGNGVEKAGDQVSNGGVSTVTADLQPGTYEFYCSVPGHEAAGMKGTLTVT